MPNVFFVVVLRENDMFVAQGLDYDICVQGHNLAGVGF